MFETPSKPQQRPFNETTSLIVVANQLPDAMLLEMKQNAVGGRYFKEIFLRWEEFFALLPSAKEVAWHEKIDFEDEDLFYETMRLVVESDATDDDLFEDIISATDGLALRWHELLALVPAAGEIEWDEIA